MKSLVTVGILPAVLGAMAALCKVGSSFCNLRTKVREKDRRKESEERMWIEVET
jgi:hypothetical protein